MNRSLQTFVRSCFVASSLLVVAGCGGGGSDSNEFTGAARVSITASPSSIDTGDRTLVSTSIDEVHPDGIALKFSYSSGLEYVIDSAILLTENGEEVDASPLFNIDTDDETFLVFFFDQEEFEESGRATLQFELEATDEVTNGSITVDADVDDSLIDDSEEFDADSPQFQAEDGTGIEVES